MQEQKKLWKWDIWKNIRPYLTLEYGMVIVVGALLSVLLGYLCYDSLIGGIVCLPLVLIGIPIYRSRKEQRIHNSMRLEFKDLLYTLSSGLRAGYSFENAWVSAEQDMKILYPHNSYLGAYVHKVSSQIHLNVPIETAVAEMAAECDIDEIRNFAESLTTAKRSGGNLVSMMDKIASIIAEKIEVEQEIQTMLAGKKLEQRIMSIMPIAMLTYMRITNPEYIQGLYHNMTGCLVVTICILVTGLAYIWGCKIIQIEV